MTARDTGDGPGDLGSLEAWFRGVAVAGLLLGGGNSLLVISSTDDRYRAADAVRDLAIRDAELKHLEDRLDRAEVSIDRIDRGGAARATNGVEERFRDVERRLSMIEQKLGVNGGS